ncbi:MAG TPA: pseudouridine synthase [Candidatus Saccharimonadales bacterium]|jgi:pseudouridine synthase
MRINRFVAAASGLSRRQADKLIESGQIKVDGILATTGQDINSGKVVTLNGNPLTLPENPLTIMLNKPVGYVVSRDGQGAETIYSLLPSDYAKLKPIGRLDKDSSGLLLLSEDGELIQRLAHPSFNKQKVYELSLDKNLSPTDQHLVNSGVQLEDGLSKLTIQKINGKHLIVSMSEGRNRQIRRTFDALGYKVTKLHRTTFGEFELGKLSPGEYQEMDIR